MMKEVLLILLLLVHHTNGAEDVDACKGEDVTTLPETCRSIDLKPLTITGDVDEATLRLKLKEIRTITSGIEVSRTQIETFDFLPNLVILTNNDGPALKFHKNRKLTRIIFPKLQQFRGKKEAILFDQDQFPTMASRNNDSMRDFVHLKTIAIATGGSEVTCSSFIKIIPNEPVAGDPEWLLPAVIILALLNLAVIAYICILCYQRLSKEHSSDLNSLFLHY